VIYIWVRSTLDWQDEAAFKAQLPAHLEEPVALWNRTFRLPYHLFRARVREIARSNHERVAGARCAPWEEIPDGALVLPVDDDDWFAPEIGSVLAREQEAGIELYYWPSRFLEIPVNLQHQAGRLRRRVRPDTPPRWVLTTNNYAMVKRPGTQLLLRKHVRASLWLADNPGHPAKVLTAPLSLMNRTLASQTAMDRKRGVLARQKLLLAAYRYRRLYRRSVAPELGWATPYLQMMSALMAEL